MRNIVTLLLVSGIVFICSCGNGANAPIPIVPPADSSSNGSYLNIWFQADHFIMKDLSLNGVSSIQVHATDIFNATDTFWEFHMQVVDQPKNQMELNLTARGNSPTGAFTVVDNSSTLTDYSHGENKVYAIAIGSVVTVTQNNYPIKGNMNLTLYYNHATTYANDSFQLNN